MKLPAVVFDSQDAALEGIINRKVKEGDVVIIRYEGRKGGPGMPEMLAPTSQIVGMGLGRKWRLLQTAVFQERPGAFQSGTYRLKRLKAARSHS